jgi:hypothetical protein
LLLFVIPAGNLRFLSPTGKKGRVPHLRDSFIVAKVGIRATREPPFTPGKLPL